MNPSELDRCFLSGVEQGAGVREKTGRELYGRREAGGEGEGRGIPKKAGNGRKRGKLRNIAQSKKRDPTKIG